MKAQKISEHRCFDGTMGFYSHLSAECRVTMKFAVYQPPQARSGKVPVLFYLAGLTCTEETFMIKGGAQRLAAELGIMLVAPDTSPRGAGIPGEDDDWDFGTGAGFYLDAMQPPWAAHYRMFSYVTEELPRLVGDAFPADLARQGIFGHSMGGHGALVAALRDPGRYRSVSAFAPVVAPTQVAWGQKAFRNYLGPDEASWRRWDSCELVRQQKLDIPILIDQGEADQFLEQQLRPELFEAACREAGQALTLRRHAGYDHSYWFVSTFIPDHLRHHAAALTR
jgi:S-formylglutathione hydrolase